MGGDAREAESYNLLFLSWCDILQVIYIAEFVTLLAWGILFFAIFV